jgi:cell fate regulator YaaT (PSP1 superfamily)
MGCIGCSCSTGKDSSSSSVGGWKSNGGCSSGGCNRHNTYDWITALGIRDVQTFDTVEVSFKNGSRKEFFKNPQHTRATTGDWVIVESTAGGFDLGKVSLSGELVRLQMKRKKIRPDARLQAVVRKAHDRDLERLDEVRRMEKEVMIKSRAIARALDLDMKVGDVEFQGDGRKCTFFYTADGRVDFRELIRIYAREFKVKIEMRQIGARQESARIGGLGNCGRELCCSTWLTEFKSVNTAAARYQNLAINQTKLSGMCGRLKCCLNYELDAYVDALEDFPDRAERLKTGAGLAILVKTDVFKRLMYYTYAEDRGKFYPLHVDQVWEALAMLKQGKAPGSLDDLLAMAPQPEVDEHEEEEPDFENVHDVIQLPFETRKKKKKKKGKNRDRSQSAAAALENAPPLPVATGRNARPEQGRRNDGPRRPAGRGPKPEDRADQRPPQGRSEQQRPPQGKPGQRPPQGRPEPRNEKQEARPPQNKTGAGERPTRPPQQPGQHPPRQPKPDNRPQNRDEPRAPRPDQKPHPRPENRPPQGDKKTPRPPQDVKTEQNTAKPPNSDPAAGNNRNRGKWEKRGKGPKKGPVDQ